MAMFTKRTMFSTFGQIKTFRVATRIAHVNAISPHFTTRIKRAEKTAIIQLFKIPTF